MSKWLPVAVFPGLNAVDAWLTKSILSDGGWELNPLAASFGGNIFLKVVISLTLVLLLLRLKRGSGLIKILNWGMLVIVTWNFCAWILL